MSSRVAKVRRPKAGARPPPQHPSSRTNATDVVPIKDNPGVGGKGVDAMQPRASGNPQAHRTLKPRLPSPLVDKQVAGSQPQRPIPTESAVRKRLPPPKTIKLSARKTVVPLPASHPSSDSEDTEGGEAETSSDAQFAASSDKDAAGAPSQHEPSSMITVSDALAAASLDWYGIAKKLRRAAKPHQAAVLRDEMLLATATLSAVAPVVRQPTAPVPPAAKMTGPPAADVPGPPVDAVRQRCEEIGDIFFSAASAEALWRYANWSHRVRRVLYYLMCRDLSLLAIYQVLVLLYHLEGENLPSLLELFHIDYLRLEDKLEPPVGWGVWVSLSAVPLPSNKNEERETATEVSDQIARASEEQDTLMKKKAAKPTAHHASEGENDVLKAEWLLARLRAHRHQDELRVDRASGVPARSRQKIVEMMMHVQTLFGGPSSTRKSNDALIKVFKEMHGRYHDLISARGGNADTKKELRLTDDGVKRLTDKLNQYAPLGMSRAFAWDKGSLNASDEVYKK